MDSLDWINENIYMENKLVIDNVREELQNKKYEGFTFNIGDRSIRMRKARVTPKKEGLFVAFWEKDYKGKNHPYKIDNSPDLLVINICEGDRAGQFIFSKEILREKKIYTFGRDKGKMSMRVYPDWSKLESREAKKTQDWQLDYFINFDDFDIDRFKRLYNL